MNIMKRKIAFFSALVIASMVVLVGCSKEDSPSDSDFFIGTYKGTISYKNGEETKSDSDGRVTVVKVGNSYTFDFGSGIPNITNVKFEKKDDNTYVSIGEGLTGITVTASSLNMLVINDNGTWTANCKR